MPIKYWGKCVQSVAYLINGTPSIVLKGKTPYELLYNKVPSLDHLKVLGCLAYATNTGPKDKFSARFIPSIFIGYPLTQKGNKLLDINNNKIFVSMDVVFHEHIFPFNKNHKTKFNLFTDIYTENDD